ncbi:hypothetical protein ACJ5M5_002964 [Vibrio alginolyticus]
MSEIKLTIYDDGDNTNYDLLISKQDAFKLTTNYGKQVKVQLKSIGGEFFVDFGVAHISYNNGTGYKGNIMCSHQYLINLVNSVL